MADLGNIQIGLEVDYRELTGFSKTADQTKRVVRLLAKEFARTGDKSKYMSSINKIVLAQNNLSKVSRLSQSAIMKLGAKVQQETKFTDSLTLATKKLTLAQMASGKAIGNTKNKMNGSNMAIQQMGYQFGDFAVQVQGGTSAFVAFSQQGAQLAGILPMIAGPLGLSMGAAVGLSAALGILIPIGSAVGRMFFEMRDEASSLEEATSNLKSSMSDIITAVDKLEELNSHGNLTSASLAMISIAESSERIAQAQFGKSLRGFMDNLSAENSTMQTTIEVLKQLGLLFFTPNVDFSKLEDESIYNKGFESLGLSVSKSVFDGAKGGLKKAFEGKDLGKQLKALQSFRDVLAPEGAIPPTPDNPEGEMVTYLPSLVDGIAMLKQTEEMIKVLESKVSFEQKALDKLSKKANDKKFAAMKSRGGGRGIASPSKVDVALMGIGPQDAGLEARLKLEADLEKARETFYKKTMSGLVDEFNMLKATNGKKGEALLIAKQQLKLDKLRASILKHGGTSTERNDAIELLKANQALELQTYRQIEAEKKLTEEQRKRKKVLAEMETQVTKAIKEEKAKQKKLADSIANSFGNAFMSMVDGTKSVKDAFKSMASDIVKELYRVLVVQQMVNAISGGVQNFMAGAGPAQGPMPSGNVIPSYSGGGYTGSGSRSGGLDGKGGFMSMLHPQETVIDHTKRKSSGGSTDNSSVVINQSFNFSANGDDSVKKLIAQAAPQIAKMTKSEIINDRKRGGSMKAAFG